MVVLDKYFPDAKISQFGLMVALEKEAASILMDLRLEQQNIWNYCLDYLQACTRIP